MARPFDSKLWCNDDQKQRRQAVVVFSDLDQKNANGSLLAEMYAAVVIPNFSLQAILRVHEDFRARPFAVIDEENRVLQMTAAARESYVEPGMTPTQAMARCQKIILRARKLGEVDQLLQFEVEAVVNGEQVAAGQLVLSAR